jgi:hypothetical protein
MDEQSGLPQDQTALSGWVWDTNVHALVAALGGLVNYEPDDWDWNAIDFGLAATDAEACDRWYTYPLVGTRALTLAMANEPGASVTSVRVHHPGDPVLLARIETVLALLSRFHVAF